jgi:superfamily II DNA/RNA helicase
MVQAKRNEAIKRLTDGRVNVLIATDVAARGIDIPDVSHVLTSICRAPPISICTVSVVPAARVKRHRHFSG